MRVFKTGSEVRVRQGDNLYVPGSVCGVSIRGERITYEVAWWSGATRHCEWLEEHEVTTCPRSKRQSIGFHNEK
jgi:hypothetical protein